MGCRRPLLFCAALVLAASACSEQDQHQPAAISGPGMASAKPQRDSCDYSALNSLITSYFTGGSQSAILSLKQSMSAFQPNTEEARDLGFIIMDSIGSASRQGPVNAAAGAQLTLGLIRCMFDASEISYPADPATAFTAALSNAAGGAYYVRGDTNSGRTATVLAAMDPPGSPDGNLSGLAPPSGSSWQSILAASGAEGRALIYGFPVGMSPLVYEWATVPNGVEFSPSVSVAVCDNSGGTFMVHETNVGVLAFEGGNTICGSTIETTVALRAGGWGSRTLAMRLADLFLPEPLQATALGKLGSGGTATTFKSKFSTQSVDNITLKFQAGSTPKTMFISQMPYDITVRATTGNDGVNGVCVTLSGSNNNGQPTALAQTPTSPAACNTPPGAVSLITKSNDDGIAGYAAFELTVTKTGGLTITASSPGAVGINGQTVTPDFFKTNVKP